ncbi:squamosa promoter-binding-like protein 12 [Tanacetum coccineum]
MEWNWDNEVPKSLAVSSHENGEYLRGEDMERGFSNGIMEEGSVISGEALFGLKLGQETYNQDKLRMSSIPLVPTSLCSPAVKKSRAVYQSSHSSRCQVEGCNLDLVSAKDYHRRHKICADHSKSPKVVVAGLERRLHDLSEFDDRKRSCRRRLSAHNARRRRPQSDDKFSSSHRRPHMGFFVNGVSTSTPSANSTPQSSSNFKREDVDMISSGALSDISSSFHGVTPRLVNHDGLDANSNSICKMEVRHSFSLQATSSWGFNSCDEPSKKVFLTCAPGTHVKVETLGCVSQPDWPAVICGAITAGQSGCDTQPDVPTLTCAPGAHVRKTFSKNSIP